VSAPANPAALTAGRGRVYTLTMNRLAGIFLACVVGVGGCSIGAPPGFSGGDQWSFPLVGPLEDGVLITPVFINDKGPYLMAIDTDSPISQIDDALVGELQLHSGLGPKMLDESDTNRPSKLAEVLHLKLGSLTVDNRTFAIMRTGSYNAGGRQVRGILGRDVIADSLVFGFDRERGTAFLATQKGFTAPVGAVEMSYDVITNRLRVEYPVPSRKVARVQVNDKSFKMHLDLGAVTSQLRKGLWDNAGLAAVPLANDLRDEVGTVRHTTEAAAANTVATSGFTATGVTFAPYEDKRWAEEDIDGALGLSFFRMMNVSANWDAERFYLTPRGDMVATTKERIARWGSTELAGCAHVGCVSVELIEQASGGPAPGPGLGAPGDAPSGAPGAGGPPGAGPAEPRPVLVAQRDATSGSLDLELLVVALGGDGQPIDQPKLVINLPAGTDTLSNQLDPAYSGSKLVVVDVSPYPRQCARGTGCVQALANVR
jgi:hypothetical protein